MSGLEFTEETARQLERILRTRDVVAQRSETIKQLALSPGERVLDVGCGPGFLCESMAYQPIASRIISGSNCRHLKRPETEGVSRCISSAYQTAPVKLQHFRQPRQPRQPYGPKLSLRKLIWVQPYRTLGLEETDQYA